MSELPINLSGTPTYKRAAGASPDNLSVGNREYNPLNDTSLNYLTPKKSGYDASSITMAEAAADRTGRFKTVMYGYDNEEAAAQRQSILDKGANGILKGVNLTATTIAGGFGMLYGAAKAPFTGRLADIWDNGIMRRLDEWNNEVDNKILPNYYTKAEREAAWYSPTNWFTANFLFDKLIKNSGFAVGAMLSGNIASAGLLRAGAALGRVATAGAVAAESSQAFKIFTPLLRNTARAFSAGKNVEAAAALESQLSSIADVTAKSSELANIAKATARQFAEFNDAARRTAIAAYSSAGEASFEALQTANQYRDSLIQDYVDKYGEQPSGQVLEDINTKANQVGKTSFLGNLALLSVTEYVQLPYLLGSSYRNTKQAANVFAGRVDDVIAKGPETKLGKLYERATGIGRYIFDPKEAGQEVGQYALQVGTQNYFNKAAMSEDANIWVDGFLYGFVGRDEEGKGEGALVSKEGMEGFLLGGLTGGPLQARAKIAEKKAKTENTARFLQQIEAAPSFKEAFVDKMNSINRGVVLQEQHEAAIVTGNELEARDLRADMTHNYLAPRIKYGRFDMVMEDITELRTMSSTETGLAELKAQGIANVNDTIQSFQKRLSNFETTAKNTNEIYNNLYIRYAGERLDNGNAKYSPYVLDKMAYAASKIADYDVRIPQLNNILTENGILISDLLNNVLKGQTPTRKATSNILNQINELSTTSTVKDGLKTALQDIITLGERRKTFMEEYEDIKANPLNYQTDPEFKVGDSIELPVGVVQKVPKEKGKRRKVKEAEKKIQVGREYSLAEPIRKDGTVLHLAPKLTILSQTLGGELEVKLPGGKVTFMAPEELKDYNLSEQDNTSDELAKILDDSIDTVLAKDKYKELPKMEEGETKLGYLNSLGDQAVVDDVEKEFNKQASDYIKTVLERKRREDELKKNKASLDQQQNNIQQTSGGIPTGDPTKEVPYVEPPLKDETVLFTSTTTESEGSETWEIDVTKSDPHIQRSREFLNNAKKFKNRPNLRTILVNHRNVDLLKLTGMIQMSYSLDKGTSLSSIPKVDDVNYGFIGAVFVEQDGSDLHFVDKNGNRIGKVGVDAPSLDAIIFQTMPTIDLLNRKNQPRYRSGQEQGAKLYSEAWAKYRQSFWNADPAKYPVSEFVISRGRPRKRKVAVLDDNGNPVLDATGKPVMQGEKNHVGDILIPDNLVSLVKGFIEIPTTGTISHNGETITFPKGRPVAHFGDTLQFLNNSKFSSAQANTIFQVIKAMADDVSAKVAAGKPVELGVRFTSFLQNVMWWNTRTNPVENQIFVDTNTMELSIGKKKYPLLQIASFEGEIVGDLLNTYHSVNKNTLDNKFDQKFYELYAVKDKTTGQTTLEEREWANYQAYLLSSKYPDGKARPIEQTPLYTDVAKAEPGIPYSFAQKYATLSAIELPVQKVATPPPAPAPTVTPSGKPKVGNYIVDGTTPNTIPLMEPFGKTTFTAIEEESITLPDGTTTPVFRVDAISEGVAELVKKKEAGDPMAIKQVETYRQILRSDARFDEANLSDAQVGNVIANISISSKLVNMKKAEQAAVAVPVAPVAPAPTVAPVSDIEAKRAEIAEKQKELQVAADNQDREKYLSATLAINKLGKELAALEGAKPAPPTPPTPPPTPGPGKFKAPGAEGDFREVAPGEEKLERISEEELNLFKKWAAENLPTIPYEILDNVIKINSTRKAWGAFENGVAKFMKTGLRGTEYHEMGEAVWNGMLSPEEQQAIIADERTKGGTFVDRASGRTLEYATATDRQIKERIMDDFADYRLGKLPARSLKERVLRFFKAIMDFFKSFIQKPSLKEELFKAIDTGKFKTRIMFPSVYNAAAEYRAVAGLTEQETREFVDDMTARAAIYLFRDAKKLLYSPGKITGTEVFEYIKSRYNQVDAEFRLSDETFNQLAEKTRNRLRTIGITINEDDRVSLNNENNNSRDYAPEPFSIDWKKNSPGAIKFMLATLIKVKPISQQDLSLANPEAALSPNINGYQLLNFSRSFATVLDKLSNTSSVQDAVSKVFELAKDDANYISFVKRLGGNVSTATMNFDQFKDEDWRLFINFYQAFTKQKPDAVIEYISGNDVYTGSANLQSAKRQTQSKWIENIKTMAQDPKSIIKYNSASKDKTYDVNTSILNSLPTKSVADKIDFLSAIGIQFPMEAWQRLSDVPKKRKGKSDQQRFDDAVEAIKTYFGTERSILTLRGKTLKVGGPMSTLAELYVKTTNPDQANVYTGVEGTQVGSYADSNAASVFENEFNESNTLAELKEKRPELNDVFSKNSVTLKSGGLFYNAEGQAINTFKVGYIQGGKNVETDRALANSRLSLGYRYTQEINQNIDGNYYILNPGDGSTPWMMNIGNNVSYENIAAGRGWNQIFDIFTGYLEDDIALALDWKNRSKLANIGNKAKELRFFKEILPPDVLDEINAMIEDGESLEDIMAYVKENKVDINESVRVFIDDTVVETKELLIDNRQVNVAGENLFSYAGLNSDFATREKINKNKMSEDVLNNLLTFVNANYVIANIEYHKILFGDPYQFKITDKEGNVILDETKRIKSFLSPRRVTFDSVEYNNFLNRDKNKAGQIELSATDEKGNVTPGYHTHKSYANTITITDDTIVGSLANVMAVYGEKKGKGAINVADSASWLMDNTYREIKLKNAQWGDEAEAFHQWQMAYTRKQLAAKGLYEYPKDGELKQYDAALTSKPSPKFVLEVLKPIVTGNKYDKSNFDLVLDKFSQMPIYYSMVENTNLENLYLKMMNSGIGYAIAESGRKVGTDNTYSLYNENGSMNDEPFNNMIQVPWKAYGIQVENSYEGEKQQTRGSQLTKIVTIDLFENGVPVSKEALKAFQRNTMILDQMHENAYKELLIKLGIEDLDNGFVLKDGTAISEALVYEMLRRELSDNAIDTVQLDENNQFRIPFEASPSYQQIKNIMYSFIHKAVSSPKMNGGPHVQAPVTGFEKLGSSRSLVRKVDGKFVKVSQSEYEKLSDKEKKTVFLTDNTLKFYTKDAPYMEVLLPNWFKVKMGTKFKDEKALLDYLNKTEEGKKILSGIGFRIPTQAVSSAEVFRVKGFLPDYMGMTVIVPAEITTKAGSDFDIDKLNMYLKSIYIDKNGDIRLVKYQGSEEATKEFFANEFDEIVKNKIIKKDELREAVDIRAYGLPDPKGLEEKYSNLLDTLLEDVEDPAQLNEKITKELEKLQDADIQAVLKEKYVKDMYKRSLENEYYDSLEEILTLPEVFERMITPVDDAGLSKEAERISKLRGERDIRANRLLDRNYMTPLRQLYVMAKNWIGIVAVNITSHSQMQKAPTYIDPKRFMKASEKDRKFLGNGEVYLPHNKVDIGEETSFISLAGRMTADGSNQLISNRLSGYGTATVDVVKDPYLGKIIRSGLLIGPAMFLERIGAGNTAIDFLNQPIIVEYVKMLDSKNIRNLFNTANIDLIRAKFGGVGEVARGAVPFNVNNLESNIESYYQGELNREQELEQQEILTEFLKYAKMAEHSYKFTQAINYDTTKFRSGEALTRKQFRTQKAIEENIICCVEFVIEDTFLKTQSSLLDSYRQAMGAVFKTEQDKFRFITENIVMRPYAEDEYLSNDDFETIANKIKASFLDYIILTKTTLGGEMKKLMVDPDTNVAARVVEAAKKYPNLEILQKLEPTTSERADGAKSLKLIVNDRTAEGENYNQGLMRELRDYNSETNALYYDIVKLSLLQGTYTSPLSIRNIIPIEDFQTLITPVINTLADTEGLKAFEEGSFQRTNFRDDKIVPVVQPKFFMASDDPIYEQVTLFGDHYADIYQYYSSLFPNIETFGIKSTDRKILELSEKYNSMDVDNMFVKVPRVVTDRSTGEMIDMQTGQTITKQDFAIRKQKGDPSLSDFYGYKKVLNFDGSPVTYVNQKGDTIHVYKLVNLYGDSPRTVEHHSDFLPSPINNGTIKITTEIPDGDIIEYYGGKPGAIDTLVKAPGEAILIGEEPKVLRSAQASTIEREYTPENITSLKPNEVFVFGSNTEGRHGAGAAKTAMDKFGAKYGQAEGLQGQSYGIITKDLTKGKRSVPLEDIKSSLANLLIYAKNNPSKKFYVTKLGTELAGYKVGEIAQLFKELQFEYSWGVPKNVILPREYEVRTAPVIETKAPGKSIFESRTNPLNYTTDQTKALLDVQKLIDDNKQAYYLLAGYAGTGKTTIAENISNYANASGRPVVIMAPTNKAAKVLNDKLKAANVQTGEAVTIHRAVYGEPDPITGEWIPKADLKNSLIIIDESSMISKPVMDDLLQNTENRNNIVVFMGDSFQLEPVGEDPGLFTGKVKEIGKSKSELKEVRRQSLDSNILKIATVTRTEDKAYIPSESIANFEISPSKAKFVADFRNAIAAGESAVAIVATNNERMVMNQAARMSKFGANKQMIEEGESVISVANSTDFPNAETFTVATLDGEPTIHPITFEAKDGKKTTYNLHLTYFRTQDGKSRKMFFFPTLDKPSLYHSEILNAIKESNRSLFENLDNGVDIIGTKKGYKLSPDIIIGTYGYAVTAHKSQGSQWEKVFVNQNYTAPTWNAARWYYTAITRSSKDVIVLPQSANVKITPMQMESAISKIAQPDIVQPSEGTDPFTCK